MHVNIFFEAGYPQLDLSNGKTHSLGNRKSQAGSMGTTTHTLQLMFIFS